MQAPQYKKTQEMHVGGDSPQRAGFFGWFFSIRLHSLNWCLLVGFLTCLVFATAPRGCCTRAQTTKSIASKKDLERIWCASVSWKVIHVSVSCYSWPRMMQIQPRLLLICQGFGAPKGLLYILLSKKDYLPVLASIVTGISGRVVHIICSFPHL